MSDLQRVRTSESAHTHTHHTPDIWSASSLSGIRAALADLDAREQSVTARLDALLASQKDLSRELGRLDLLRAHLGTQVIAARNISNGMLSDAAGTASRISSAVKILDQVAELKACVMGVNGSMGAPQDWETAAGYLSRATKIPDDVIDGAFAEDIVPSAEVPDPPRVTLDTAAESLCVLFLKEFNQAAKDGDGAKVTRFFKLFPLIGRSEVGLDAYGRYVCQGVASRARNNLNSGTAQQRKEGFFYANCLTKLFEHIAQIVDGHEPLVEQHYGAGMMVKVIERLQIEADVQGGIIVDTWHEERNIDRKLTDIKSYAYSFLVQSFLPASKGSTGTPRSSSPAIRDGISHSTNSNGEDDTIDMKEVDSILSETALMLSRWSLYTRFISSKSPQSDVQGSRLSVDNNINILHMPDFLSSSTLAKKISSHILEPFNTMSTFFFRRSVEKAFQLDEPPSDLSLNPTKPLPSNPPYITSSVDDVMYIVNQVLQRSMATSQRGVIGAVVPDLGRVLGNDFVGMVQRRMRDETYPKAAIAGALPPEDKVLGFLVLINNLDVANEYLARIVSQQLGSPDTSADGEDIDQKRLHSDNDIAKLRDLFPFNHDAAFAHNTLSTLLAAFRRKTSDLLSDSIAVTFHQVLKPRIRPILTEAFRDTDYALNSTELERWKENTAEQLGLDGPEDTEELVKNRFERQWRALTLPLKRILTAANWERLLSVTLPSLSKSLESRIKSLAGKVNELGAVRLERDISGIVSAAVAGGRYKHREAFTRVVQMAMVLGMEAEEWDEMVKAEEDGEEMDGGVEWVLTVEEREWVRGIVAR
jgi:conserved oligomeric Golgi complex subunit 4